MTGCFHWKTKTKKRQYCCTEYSFIKFTFCTSLGQQCYFSITVTDAIMIFHISFRFYNCFLYFVFILFLVIFCHF